MIRYLNLIRSRSTALWIVAILALAMPAKTDAAEYSDGQLKSFVMAVLAINEIAEKWQPQVQAAESEDQAAEMLQQVDTEMRQAIEGTDGIGIDDYQSIMTDAQEDPELKSQIDGMLQEMAPN